MSATLWIRPLAERPEWVESLADWHYEEWGGLYGAAWSLALCRQELQRHAAAPGCPGTWVAEEVGVLMGSVSVVEKDADELSEVAGPWLASLYVRPAARGRGLGRALIRAAEAAAREAGFPRLWLFTLEHTELYRALGWQLDHVGRVQTTPVTVMHRDLVRQ